MVRILVIDDDSELRTVLGVVLEGAGYEVVEAADGAEGLERYQASPTDLVLTDLIMPGQEGVETIIDLRREFPDVKIIAMSGGGRNDPRNFLDYASKLGASETLEKPFSRDLLLETISKVLA